MIYTLRDFPDSLHRKLKYLSVMYDVPLYKIITQAVSEFLIRIESGETKVETKEVIYGK